MDLPHGYRYDRTQFDHFAVFKRGSDQACVRIDPEGEVYADGTPAPVVQAAVEKWLSLPEIQR